MAKKDSDITLCFPGEDGWELWAERSGRLVLSETRPLEEGNEAGCEPFQSASHYAFPEMAR